MATPWERKVRETGTLTIFDETSVGQWANVFALALASFNKFSARTGVKYVRADDADTANVVMRLGNGVVSYEYQDGREKKNKRIEGFDPKSLHGLTSVVAYSDGIAKAHIFLPANPQVTSFDRRGNETTIAARPDALRIIAVHELIHAAGLEHRRDHGGDGIFYFPLSYRDGKMYVPERGKENRLMPPIRFGDDIISNLKALW